MAAKHALVWELECSALLKAVREVDFRRRRCVEAYFRRCAQEAINSPREALPLLYEALEYVKRCKRILYPDYWSFRTRAYGLLGSCFANISAHDLAIQMFEKGRSLEGKADPIEIAALECRAALMEVYRGNWQLAMEVIDKQISIFDVDSGRIRDDRCVSFALVTRGVVRDLAYRAGAAIDPNDALKDFRLALRLAPARLALVRLSAVNGICVVAIRSWFEGQSTGDASPPDVVALMTNLRRSLRRQRVPRKSLIDSKARWILGLATYKLVGGISRCCENHLIDARAVLMEEGLPSDVVQLTFDYQWCLVEEGRWAAALREWKYIEERLDFVPEPWKPMLAIWYELLSSRLLDAEVLKRVFKEIRGARSVQIPNPTVDTDPIGF